MLEYLRMRAIPGVEVVENNTYRRTLGTSHCIGSVAVTHLERLQSLSISICFPDVRELSAIVTRVRRLFDIDADIETIDAHLCRDEMLAPLVAQRSGLRAPGSWDGFELAVRAILGQQITVTCARKLAGQLAARHGRSATGECVSHPMLTHLFPSAVELASVETIELAMPAARRSSLKAMAEAAGVDSDLFQASGPLQETVARFRKIKGVGEWTAQYIALRAVREMDAFPAADIGLLRGAEMMDGCKYTPASLLARSEAWRPWRGYAAQHLWEARHA